MQVQGQTLVTRWAADVSPDNVLPEYPRPQLARPDWLNLNGLWSYAIVDRSAEKPGAFDGEILVPFPVESHLSGVSRRVGEGDRLWYQRVFEIPAGWEGQRVLLHFGAVDWEAIVWVNGVELGMHRGGYDPFSFDITDALAGTGEQTLTVAVWDPADVGTQPRGKQVNTPDGIWYTPATGIWQTVWLEPVPAARIDRLKMTPDIDAGLLRLEVATSAAAADYGLRAAASSSGETIAEVSGPAGETLEVRIENPKLWSPDSPHLYDLTVTLLDGDTVIDEVTSYFGMRKIALAKDDNGIPKLFLNNEPLFNFGLLDQGFWPDGLYTAPTDEALRYDIEETLRLGFNTIRKHVKVEPARWYYWADRLGMLVWQDMPNGDRYVKPGDGELERQPASAEQFELELARMVETLYNYPSLIIWVIFNEGWGQYDTVRMTEWLRQTDPTHVINSVSGWNDMGVGDIYDIHQYPGPDVPPGSPLPDRAAVLGEFGGLGLPVEGHTWKAEGWGYRAYEDVESLQAAYTALIEELDTLRQQRGLAAAIYTQTTDVETEINGLITYDREVVKLDPEYLSALHKSLYR
jgi:beta-galactosidase/beta-glucuronidase